MTVAQVRAIVGLTKDLTPETNLMTAIYPNQDYKIQFMKEGQIFMYRIKRYGEISDMIGD